MYITTSAEKRIRYSVGYYAHNSVWTCELGYGADTMLHRTYFLLSYFTILVTLHYRLCYPWLWWLCNTTLGLSLCATWRKHLKESRPTAADVTRTKLQELFQCQQPGACRFLQRVAEWQIELIQPADEKNAGISLVHGSEIRETVIAKWDVTRQQKQT